MNGGAGISCERHSPFWAASEPDVEQLGTITSGTVLAIVLGPRSERSMSVHHGPMLLPLPSSSTCLQLSDVFGHLWLASWGHLSGMDRDFHVLWWHIRNSEIHRLIAEITVYSGAK